MAFICVILLERGLIMMIHAYDEIYLEDAMNNFAVMLDYGSQAYEGDIEEFFNLLDKKLQLAKESLLHRYGVLKNLKVKDLPFVAGQGLLKGSEGLSKEKNYRMCKRTYRK